MDTYFGKDCLKGKVQVEFVTTNSEMCGKYGWKPADFAAIDVYIDGIRYFIKVGDFHDGNAQRRGIQIIGTTHMKVDKASANACSIYEE